MQYLMLPFLLLEMWLRALTMKVLGKRACKYNLHDWKYTRENYVLGEPKPKGMRYIRRVPAHVRICSLCHRKQMSYVAPASNAFISWKDTTKKDGDVIISKMRSQNE